MKKTYNAPACQETEMELLQLMTPSITDTGGADGLGTGDDEGTGEAGIDFGNAKERDELLEDGYFAPEDSIW